MDTTPLKTVILSAPQGWGKTHKAHALQQEFGCTSVIEEWEPQQALQPNALHLTSLHPSEMPGIEGLPCRLVTRGWKS